MNADVAQMNAERARLNALSHKVIGCAQRVSSVLGCGFLEKVYENALLKELRDEIKAVIALDRMHRQQCLNYLRATGLRLGLVLNFGRPHLEVARVVSNF